MVELGVRCPACSKKIKWNGLKTDPYPVHTDKYIRALANELGWQEFAVCAQCYENLRTYNELVMADQRPKPLKELLLPEET
jgi:hypothetical protein